MVIDCIGETVAYLHGASDYSEEVKVWRKVGAFNISVLFFSPSCVNGRGRGEKGRGLLLALQLCQHPGLGL